MPALTDLPWPVRTERLVLRPVRASDADAIWAYRHLPAVHEWVGGDPGPEQEHAARLADPDASSHRIAVELDGLVVGEVSCVVGDAWSQREVAERAAATEASIGWMVHPDHHGRGLATEAVGALIGICFTPVTDGGLGLRRVTAACFADNTASWRLMERLGMRREQHGVRDSLHRDRGWLDGYTYALLADEWRGRPQHGPAPREPG